MPWPNQPLCDVIKGTVDVPSEVCCLSLFDLVHPAKHHFQQETEMQQKVVNSGLNSLSLSFFNSVFWAKQ